jgi:hypothetical protein
MDAVTADRLDEDSLDQEDSLDTHFRADMTQGRYKQRSLRSCGFINTLEQQVGLAGQYCSPSAVALADCPVDSDHYPVTPSPYIQRLNQ